MEQVTANQLAAAAMAQQPGLFNPRNTDPMLDEARANALASIAAGFIAAGFAVEGYGNPTE